MMYEVSIGPQEWMVDIMGPNGRVCRMSKDPIQRHGTETGTKIIQENALKMARALND